MASPTLISTPDPQDPIARTLPSGDTAALAAAYQREVDPVLRELSEFATPTPGVDYTPLLGTCCVTIEGRWHTSVRAMITLSDTAATAKKTGEALRTVLRLAVDRAANTLGIAHLLQANREESKQVPEASWVGRHTQTMLPAAVVAHVVADIIGRGHISDEQAVRLRALTMAMHTPETDYPDAPVITLCPGVEPMPDHRTAQGGRPHRQDPRYAGSCRRPTPVAVDTWMSRGLADAARAEQLSLIGHVDDDVRRLHASRPQSVRKHRSPRQAPPETPAAVAATLGAGASDHVYIDPPTVEELLQRLTSRVQAVEQQLAMITAHHDWPLTTAAPTTTSKSSDAGTIGTDTAS